MLAKRMSKQKIARLQDSPFNYSRENDVDAFAELGRKGPVILPKNVINQSYVYAIKRVHH